MVIKEEIVADPGLRARVGVFASDPGMAYAGAGLAAGVEFIAPTGMFKRYNKCKLFR